MTPSARIAAAIVILDRIREGATPEQALGGWARASRFAGSKDRAAIRDHVFDVLRARRSLGDGSGRALMLRLALREGWDIEQLFDGAGHAPEALSAEERGDLDRPLALSKAAACDIPDWLWPAWQESLSDQAETVATGQTARAPIFLRVNRRRVAAPEAAQALAADGVATVPHEEVVGCLRVLANERRVRSCKAYLEGLVELQDAASQSAVTACPAPAGGRVLDYCAGGGGKALAFADMYDAQVYAHDVAPQRMVDLPERAKRARVDVTLLPTDALAREAPFDVVFCDAPCSGSGTWRRTPDAKWRLTPERLTELRNAQEQVIRAGAALTSASGVLAYATCSVLRQENDDVVDGFLNENSDWQCIGRHQSLPDDSGDGFYFARLTRSVNNNL